MYVMTNATMLKEKVSSTVVMASTSSNDVRIHMYSVHFVWLQVSSWLKNRQCSCSQTVHEG